MTLRSLVRGLLVTAILLVVGVHDAAAQFGRTLGGSPAQPQVVFVPVPVPAYAYGLSLAQTAPYVAPNPYVAPFPWYTILPPVSPYGLPHWGSDVHGWDARRRSAEDYGYQLDYTPRKRPAPDPTVVRTKPVDTKPDPRRARFEITVPTPDAIVIFDGAKTKQTGLERVFVTPPLEEDRIYLSTIEIQWTDTSGKTRSDRKEFEVFQGDRIRYSPKVNP